MNARIHQPQVTSDGLSLDVRFQLENRTAKSLGPDSDFAVGWQLYDPGTDLFIAEGDWTAMSETLSPGQDSPMTMRIALPPEAGRYHIYISPRTEADGWQYEQLQPFLLIEADVAEGQAAVASSGITTLPALRRRDWGRKSAATLYGPFRTLWKNRRLVSSMTRRDIAGRYRGSTAGMLWTVLNPLLLMLTYTFVFGIVLGTRFEGDTSPTGFVLYFLAGMLSWLPLSEAVVRSPSIVYEHRNFVKKLVFPVEILPVHPALAALVSEAIALILFFILLLGVRGSVPATAVALPMLIVPQLLLTIGVCWLLAAIGVFLRDLGQVIGFLMTLIFFLTPICYDAAKLPASAVPILSKSPVFILVAGYREILLHGRLPSLSSMMSLWIPSVLIFLLGYTIFARLRRTFPDVI